MSSVASKMSKEIQDESNMFCYPIINDKLNVDEMSRYDWDVSIEVYISSEARIADPMPHPSA